MTRTDDPTGKLLSRLEDPPVAWDPAQVTRDLILANRNRRRMRRTAMVGGLLLLVGTLGLMRLLPTRSRQPTALPTAQVDSKHDLTATPTRKPSMENDLQPIHRELEALNEQQEQLAGIAARLDRLHSRLAVHEETVMQKRLNELRARCKAAIGVSDLRSMGM